MKLGFIGQNDLEGLEEDAVFAAANGFQGLEFNWWSSFDEVTEDHVKAMKRILDKNAVEASALGLWGWNHISRDADERKAALTQLERAVNFAQLLEAGIVITGGGDIPGASLEDKVAEFAGVFPPFVEKVEKAGMKMAMYPVHGNSFFVDLECYQKAWEAVPQVGIKFDAANILNHGDDYIQWVRRHGDKVYYVHIKEHLYHGGELASQPAAGMGDVEWGKIMAFLHEHGYDGYLSVEPHGSIWGREPMRRKMLLLSKRWIEQFLA
ncbi:MAG: sugar phosphate isomerase/epimerase [Planctomycetes bacterium]|nr:sugar phosphate isomerase/epimerase [Planctomycetota bacterium]